MEELNVKLIDVTKVTLEPGDILMVTVKSDEVDNASMVALREQMKRVFPNNQVMVFGIGSNDDVKIVAVEQAQPTPSLNYCSDCSCGKKAAAEGT